MNNRNVRKKACGALQFEWQFQDERGFWTTYGGPYDAGKLQSSRPSVASDDIEEYFCTDSDRLPLFVESLSGQFQLDFHSMTETNKKASVQRPIRRIPKQGYQTSVSQEETGQARGTSSGLAYRGAFLTKGQQCAPFSDQGSGASSNYFAGHGAIEASRGGSTGGGSSRFPSTTKQHNGALRSAYVWQFQDCCGAWITYGKTNPVTPRMSATLDTSDDIEDFHSRFPDEPFMITRSNFHTYQIDFRAMTQTNTATKVCRQIRRLPREKTGQSVVEKLTSDVAAINVKEARSTCVEWQFKDERGVWTPYGEPNSAGYVAAATYTTSQDIERFYSQNHGKKMMRIKSKCNKYELNFQNMTQTNLRTKVQRPIRRVGMTT